jgi:hypothetical protein
MNKNLPLSWVLPDFKLAESAGFQLGADTQADQHRHMVH